MKGCIKSWLSLKSNKSLKGFFISKKMQYQTEHEKTNVMFACYYDCLQTG